MPHLQAGEIRVLALQSPQIVLNELAQAFERTTGYRILEISSPNEMPTHIWQRINAGETFDVAFLVPEMLDQFSKESRVEPSTRTNFLRVPIGVAVKSGATRPDISSVEAFEKTVLAAHSIAYLKSGISGPHLQRLFERFGLAEQVQKKAKRPETDTVGELVATGEAELGVTAIATLMATPGIDVIGPIPTEIQAYVCFAGAVSANARARDGAKALLDFVTGPAAGPVIQAKGMTLWSNGTPSN